MSQAVAVFHGAFGRAAVYELDRAIITHAHREGHLIFFVGGSTATVMVDGEPVPIDRGHGVAVGPWRPHSFALDRRDSACLALTLYIKPLWFRENCPQSPLMLDFGRPDLTMTEAIAGWVDRLTALLLSHERESDFDHVLLGLTRASFEHSWHGVEQSALLERQCGRFTDFRVRRSLHLMRENFAEEVEMRHLAREVGLSRPHFFKLFKRQMGVTPNLYLNTLRAEQAITELLRTAKSVTDIAYDLGFSSQASFTRFFASNVGIAPSEYRRAAQVS